MTLSDLARSTKPEYRITLSESGLLVNIAVVYPDGHASGEVTIITPDWPRIVYAVDQAIAERKLIAQAENIVADALDPGDERL